MILKPDWEAIYSLLKEGLQPAIESGHCTDIAGFLSDIPFQRVDKDTGEAVTVKLMDFVNVEDSKE